MDLRSTWKKLRANDAFVIVGSVSLVVVALMAFEQVTGLPASIRGTPVYNALPMPPVLQETGEEARIPTVSALTKERVCERIVRSFSSNSLLWERVNERILGRLGFSCSR